MRSHARDNLPKEARPRVLFVIPCEPDDGQFVFAKRQVDALEKAGVVAERFFLRSRTSPSILAAEFCRLRRVIHHHRPDIIHAHFGTMTAFFCVLVATLPVVITFHGSDLNPLRGAMWLRHSCAHLLSQISSLRAAQIICVSEQLRSALWYSRAAVCAHVLPLGVDAESFALMDKRKARRGLGWAVDARVVLFNAGRAHQRSNKRLDLAQAAIHEAEAQAGHIQFVVLDGFVPPEHIPLMMNGADCLLVTSDYEGSPTIVKEAMACNLPVVSVDVGDVPERLRDVHPSRIVARDPVALGQAICGILKMNCRSNGREIVVRDLSEAATVQRVLDVYRKVTSLSTTAVPR